MKKEIGKRRERRRSDKKEGLRSGERDKEGGL